jgi:hypothetical protein
MKDAAPGALAGIKVADFTRVFGLRRAGAFGADKSA